MNGHDHIETDTSGIAPLLERLGGRGTPGEAPRAFIGRVRRRRLARRATRAAGAAAAVVLATYVGILFLRPPTPAGPAWTYTDVQWPPMPELNTGGPVLPIRAGIRATDPMATSLLQ
jgi:hypothetical protein